MYYKVSLEVNLTVSHRATEGKHQGFCAALLSPLRCGSTYDDMLFRGAAAAVIVFDITNTDSFVKAQKWVKELAAAG